MQKLTENPVSRQFAFSHRDRALQVVVTADGTLQLFLDGVLRKDRPDSGREPQYVWTNVELQWEEHHYVEARYWQSDQRLQITINRLVVHELRLKA